jgi:hypothetical protein
MVSASHVVEKTVLSGQLPGEGLRKTRLRRLILIGLATAMALATLAPAVVLAA